MTVLYVSCFAGSLLLSFLLTWTIRNIALRHGWGTKSPSERDVHTYPIPRLGGVAIFLAMLVTSSAVVVVSWTTGHPPLASFHSLLALLLPALVIFAVGFADDLFDIGLVPKFAAQIVAAMMLFYGGIRVFHAPLVFGGRPFTYTVSLLATILWVLWITNAFNLIDGLDGLAAGSALFSTIVVCSVALIGNSPQVAAFSIVLAGAILGFLRFNFNPATIFLGDSGSLLIGFLLSAMALLGSEKAPTLIAVAIPVVSFGLPILDTALAVVRRFLSGKPVFGADADHIHHRLLKRGFSQRKVVLLLYAVSAMFALGSLFLLRATAANIALLLLILGIGVWVGIQHLHYPEWSEIQRVARRTLEQRDIITNNVAIRRAIEQLPSATSFEEVCQLLRKAFASNEFQYVELVLQGDGHAPRQRCWAAPEWSQMRAAPKWSLDLEFAAGNDSAFGTLRLRRTCSEKPILLDVNIVAVDLQMALSKAAAAIAAGDRKHVAGASVAARS